MRRLWPYAVCFLLVVYGALIVIFPLGFIRSGWLDMGFLEPFNWAVSMSQWHWDHGFRYSCGTVSLLGFTSSFSVVVPAYVDGMPSNLVAQVDQDDVIFIWISDMLFGGANEQYRERSAQFNSVVLADCGFGPFQ